VLPLRRRLGTANKLRKRDYAPGRFLEFRDIPPIDLWGVFGGMTDKNRVITLENPM